MTKHDKEIVSDLARALAENVGQERFELWFHSNTRFALSGDDVVVQVPNRFFLDWVRRNFRAELEAACRSVLMRDPEIRFELQPELESDADVVVDDTTPVAADADEPESEARPWSDGAASGTATLLRPPKRKAPSNTRRRFASLESFAVGECNRLAFTSVRMAVERPGHVTPLFLYGPTGAGKTHLLEGLYSGVRRNHRELRVVYRSAEQFTAEYVAAIHGGRGLPSFRHRYRGVGLLILDDIQFFRGKRATLVELLHTIENLTSAGRQVVLAADRSTCELVELGPEITTRLAAGLVCRLDPPDYDTRLAIVRRLARRQELVLPADVCDFIAANLTAHAWELAGAVNRLQATSLALSEPITLSLAESALGEMIRDARRELHLPDIQKAVCQAFGLEPAALMSSRRSRQVSHPRMLAMWLARKHTRAAYSEIGHYFGRKSHSTVISAQKKVEHWMQSQTEMHLADRTWSIDDAIRAVEKNLAAG